MDFVRKDEPLTSLLLHPPKSDEKYAQKSVQLVRGSSFRNDFLQNPYFNSPFRSRFVYKLFLSVKIFS